MECVSDSSVVKDCERLRERYYCAGLREYWLVDARGEDIDFQVLVPGTSEYESSLVDENGFVRSEVLDLSVRLVRSREAAGLVFYRLEVRQ